MSLRIKAIVFLMGIALLGLIFIQFYWIDNAMVVKEDEFNQKVYIALHNVINDLERREALEKFQQHQLGKKMIHQYMMMRKHEMLRRKKQLIKSLNNSNNIGTSNQNPVKSYSWISKTQIFDSNTSIIKKVVLRDGIRGSSIQISINDGEILAFDSLMDIKIDQKTAVIDDILFDLTHFNKPIKIEERLSDQALDSVIKMRLKEE